MHRKILLALSVLAFAAEASWARIPRLDLSCELRGYEKGPRSCRARAILCAERLGSSPERPICSNLFEVVCDGRVIYQSGAQALDQQDQQEISLLVTGYSTEGKPFPPMLRVRMPEVEASHPRYRATLNLEEGYLRGTCDAYWLD